MGFIHIKVSQMMTWNFEYRKNYRKILHYFGNNYRSNNDGFIKLFDELNVNLSSNNIYTL